MSEDESAAGSHLPEDVGRWPWVPHEVLGVPADADSREVKRAYARLLRIYRPDDSPQEFGRLREAKDAMLDRRESAIVLPPDWTPTDPSAAAPSAATDETGDTTSPGSATWSVAQPAGGPHPSAAPTDPVAVLWRQAIDGEADAARDGLSALAQKDARAALALYWLGRLHPRRSDDRPADALLGALSAPGDRTSLVAQLAAAARLDASVLIDDRIRPHLADSREVLRLLPARWSTLANQGRLEEIAADLEAMQWVASDVRSDILRLLLEKCGLFEEDAAIELTRRALVELDDVQSGDGLDLEVELAREALLMRAVTPPPAYGSLCGLLARWPHGRQQEREHLRPLLEAWWQRPSDALHRLTAVENTAPTILLAWAERLERRIDADAIGQEPVEAAGIALASLLAGATTMPDARTAVLRVCRSYVLPAAAVPWWQLPNEWPLSEVSRDTAVRVLTAGWCVWVYGV